MTYPLSYGESYAHPSQQSTRPAATTTSHLVNQKPWHFPSHRHAVTDTQDFALKDRDIPSYDEDITERRGRRPSTKHFNPLPDSNQINKARKKHSHSSSITSIASFTSVATDRSSVGDEGWPFPPSGPSTPDTQILSEPQWPSEHAPPLIPALERPAPLRVPSSRSQTPQRAYKLAPPDIPERSRSRSRPPRAVSRPRENTRPISVSLPSTPIYDDLVIDFAPPRHPGRLSRPPRSELVADKLSGKKDSAAR